MAKLVGVFNMTHSPFCYMPPERWNEVRAARALREDVPVDDLEVNRAKAQRIRDGFAALRRKIEEAQPDVLIVFGDDQRECFDFNNNPSFAVYVGEDFYGHTSEADQAYSGTSRARQDYPQQTVKGHPALGAALLTGLMQRGFDPAFMMGLPNVEEGLGHAIMRPAESLTGFSLPIVPVLVNCYYAPQVTGDRCYKLGKAVRQIIDAYPEDIRVGVVGSGGLWHTPGARDAYLDEDFDQGSLRYMQVGDARGMAEHFDSYRVSADDASQAPAQPPRGTGMPGPGGPENGTRETCNWIIAAATVEGSGAEVIDYVPVYASPIGAGFAYWPSFS
jgi:hypothetical protein